MSSAASIGVLVAVIATLFAETFTFQVFAEDFVAVRDDGFPSIKSRTPLIDGDSVAGLLATRKPPALI